jgi:hypothetical protein
LLLFKFSWGWLHLTNCTLSGGESEGSLAIALGSSALAFAAKCGWVLEEEWLETNASNGQ